MNTKIIKKNYNSIPHFSFSRLGPSDSYCNPGHEKIMTEKTRDWKDLIIVTEKLDGSNVGVIKKDDQIYAITRSGYEAKTSRYKQHIEFNKWVYSYIWDFNRILNEGERIVGEWLLLAHGTKYNIKNKSLLFRPFDIFNANNERLSYFEFLKKIRFSNFNPPALLHIGQPVKIKHIEKKLQKIDSNRIERCEGAVYRCERDGKFDCLIKYVRHDKIDGKYFKDDIYNFDFN